MIKNKLILSFNKKFLLSKQCGKNSMTKVNIRQIAEMAEVSIATVSLVLNGKDGVGDSTRRKVEDILRSSGYVRKQRNSRNVSNGSLRLIKLIDNGLIIDRNEEFIPRLMDGAIEAASAHNYELIIKSLNFQMFQNDIDEIGSIDQDGLIILGTEMNDYFCGLLERIKCPFVVVDNELYNLNYNAVTMNNEQAAFLAAEHLYKLGHRRIGHITSKYFTPNFSSRERGFERAAQELGFSYIEKYRIEVVPNLEQTSIDVDCSVLDDADAPTGFFAANDIIALVAMRIFKKFGKRVPDDISIVGMDNIQISASTSPRLTTIELPNEMIGRLAIERLISLRADSNQYPYKSFVGCELVCRESTKPVLEVQ